MVKVIAFENEYKQKLIQSASLGLSDSELEALKRDLDNLSVDFEYLICIDQEDNVIGFSKTTPLEKGFLRIDYIYVQPNLRRDTNGSIILVAIMTRAVNRLIVGLLAFCDEQKNEALQFFKARGFTCFSVENNIHAFTKSLIHMYKTHNHE